MPRGPSLLDLSQDGEDTVAVEARMQDSQPHRGHTWELYDADEGSTVMDSKNTGDGIMEGHHNRHDQHREITPTAISGPRFHAPLHIFPPPPVRRAPEGEGALAGGI